MLDETSITLLKRILIASTASFRGVEALKFRADHSGHLDLLDKLQANRVIEVRQGRYYLRLSALEYIAEGTPQVGSLLYLCEHLFATMQRLYKDNPGTAININTLSEEADLPKRQIATGIAYMTEAAILEKWSGDSEGLYISITPSERILRYASFEKVIDAQRHESATLQDLSSATTALPLNVAAQDAPDQYFVHPSRIEELRSLPMDKFDLSKTLCLCDELNSCLEDGNFFSIAFLVRAIVDHLPPVFGCRNFTEVANNVAGRSMKKSFLNLDSSARNISDSLLHQQIRRTESLPNLATVDSSRDLDVLLGEIARRLKRADGASFDPHP